MTGNESYLAGAILIDGANVLPVIRGLVKPEDFQVAAYRAIFTAAASLAAMVNRLTLCPSRPGQESRAWSCPTNC